MGFILAYAEPLKHACNHPYIARNIVVNTLLELKRWRDKNFYNPDSHVQAAQ